MRAAKSPRIRKTATKSIQTHRAGRVYCSIPQATMRMSILFKPPTAIPTPMRTARMTTTEPPARRFPARRASLGTTSPFVNHRLFGRKPAVRLRERTNDLGVAADITYQNGTGNADDGVRQRLQKHRYTTTSGASKHQYTTPMTTTAISPPKPRRRLDILTIMTKPINDPVNDAVKTKPSFSSTTGGNITSKIGMPTQPALGTAGRPSISLTATVMGR